MQLAIRHATRFRFSQPLLYSVQTLHLWPVSGAGQTVKDWTIQTPGSLHRQPDGLGNRVHSFSLEARAEKGVLDFSVVAQGRVETHGVAEFEDVGPVPPPAFYLRPTPLAEPHPRMATWAERQVPALVQALRAGERPTRPQLVELANAVADQVRYRPGNTGVETTALEAFDWGLGVCQDQAHVMVAVCRSIGLPARYVSGYFYADDEPELASHAWVDVCLDAGARRWLSLDVTHRGVTDERHVRLAVATDYAACPPIKGRRRGGGDEDMQVSVRIRDEGAPL